MPIAEVRKIIEEHQGQPAAAIAILQDLQKELMWLPESALRVIRILVGPVPAVLLCAAILFAVLYPLDREGFTRIREELERRRGAIGSTE